MDPKPDLVTFAIPGRHPVAIRPYPDSVSVDLDRKTLKLRCDFDYLVHRELESALKSGIPFRVESELFSGPCAITRLSVAGGSDFHVDLELKLIEVARRPDQVKVAVPALDSISEEMRLNRTLPSVNVSVSALTGTKPRVGWGEPILARAPDESDEAMRQRLLRGVANIGPMPFRDSVRLAMADLAESHDVVPMNGDGFALVRAAVAKRMHISDVRLQVMSLGSGTIRIVLDEDRKVMDLPEAPPAAVAKAVRTYDPRSDVQLAIAHADSTGANPGSRSYMEAALQALPGVTGAGVFSRSDRRWMEHGSIAIVVDGGRSCDISDVIDLTRTAGAKTLGAERGSGGDGSWFTSPQWKSYVDSKELQAQFNVTRTLQMDTHGKDIRPGTAVFTTKCARCDVSLVYTDSTRDAEAEAHKAKCFVKGDRVRWTSPVSPDCWADGVIVNRHAMVPAFNVEIHSVCSGRTPGNAYVGSICPVGTDRLSHLPQYDSVQHLLRVNHASIGAPRSPDDPCRISGIPDMDGPVRISASGALPAGLSADRDYAVQNGRLVDPLEIEIDGMSLRYWVGRDQEGRQGKSYPRMPTAARSAVSAYWSAELRAKVAKSEADRKAREVSVVIGLDVEDL